MIRIVKELGQDELYTTIVFSGAISMQAIVGVLEDFYQSGPTEDVIWDFSEEAVISLDDTMLVKIINIAKSYAHLRRQGRTAIVAPGDLQFGWARMYETLALLEQHPIAHNVFRDQQQARQWLATRRCQV